MFRWITVLVVVSVFAISAQADSDKTAEKIKAKLVESFPTHTPDSVSKSPVNGLYEAVYGTKIVYVTDDARFIIQGAVMDLDDGKKDITQEAANRARKNFMVKVNEQESISFGAEKPKHTVTIFTDIDCGYCRKLHNEMDQYASYGIKVKYLLFPRNGLQTPSAAKAESVWCSDNRADALTKAKNGEQLPESHCQNPVAEHFEIGKQVGVSGTPAILTANGDLMPGYLPAQQLAQRLDELAKDK